MKSIDKIMAVAFCMLLLAAYVVIFGLYTNYVQETRVNETLSRLSEISINTAEITKQKISGDLYTLTSLANLISINKTQDKTQYMDFLRDEVTRNEFKRMGFIDKKGMAYLTDGPVLDFSDRDYFKLAMAGTANVSDALIDKVDGKLIFVTCAPIIVNGQVEAVLFATSNIATVQEKFLPTVYNNKGSTFVIKNDGTPVILPEVLSYMTFDNLLTHLWGQEGVKTDATAIKFKKDMEKGISGDFLHKGVNEDSYMTYQPVGINNWYSCTIVSKEYVDSKTGNLITRTIVLEVISIVLIVLFLLYIAMIKMRKQHELKYLAFTDKLTGLANWNKLKSDAKELFRQNPEEVYAMISMDIDEFKTVNDLYGFTYGNDVLMKCANSINNMVNKDELFARSTGDIFNILLKYNSNDEITDRIYELIDSINNSGLKCKLKFSFGVYIITGDKTSISSHSDRANLAKRTVKGKLDSTIAFYDEQVREQILLEHQIEQEMELALQQHQFKVYLQPKIAFKTGKIVGAEALVRWSHPVKGIIPPFKFIPLFEKNGFITKLDMYMFEQVCILIAEWNEKIDFKSDIAISVNISRIHLNNPEFVEQLSAIALKRGAPTNNIEIELTESAIFDNMCELVKIMHQLKRAGFKISIDDFGSGYSSLSLLKDIPADILKIDKAFLDVATDTVRGQKIVKSVVGMARDLGLTTVAEGVETVEQVLFLTEIGCDIAQGYYYAKPMTIMEFEAKADEMH